MNGSFRTYRPIVATLSHEEENQTNNELLTIVEREVLSWLGVISEPGRSGARDPDHPGILRPASKTTIIKGGN
jgi:hypothetical protein